ncbi:TPA: IS110 family transposase, partial [Candidatus Avacholeplasma faecigallinarum]|nr:IS110 family transposase [Candidatus Avacholeplasma faecigallinarum]
HNPSIFDFYWKKRNEGKHHRVALSHIARKLVNVIFTLEKHKVDFNPNLVK